MAKLKDLNTTDILDAIRLGCRPMCSCFNADDDDIPYGGAGVRPEARLGPDSWEAHQPGRHLNALLNAEDAAGIEVDEESIQKQARAAFALTGAWLQDVDGDLLTSSSVLTTTLASPRNDV